MVYLSEIVFIENDFKGLHIGNVCFLHNSVVISWYLMMTERHNVLFSIPFLQLGN
jgi:hypothetical protein